MRSILIFIPLFFLYNIISGQENKSTNQLNNIDNSKESIEKTTFENINISRKLFDFSKCANDTYKKCFNKKVEPNEIFNFIGVSDPKAFRKATYRQTKNFIVANIDKEIFNAAVNNNKIKFEKPYLNFSFWINAYGKPDVNFFGTNISSNKNATKKLKFIISKIYYDKTFHPEFDKLRNRQLTIFIPLGKTNDDSKYVIEERTQEEKDFYHTKVKNTFPPYFESCNGLEGTSEFTTIEKKEGIKKCMDYQYATFIRNNFDKKIASYGIRKLKEIHDINKPKMKAWVSFKINELGRPCEYQVISLFPSIEKEISRLLKKIPTSTPASYNGKNVKYKYRVPIRFY